MATPGEVGNEGERGRSGGERERQSRVAEERGEWRRGWRRRGALSAVVAGEVVWLGALGRACVGCIGKATGEAGWLG